jgi:hypothetical protein
VHFSQITITNMLLASAAWLARSHPALAALDHVTCLISELLDVSLLLTPPQAAASGYVSLFQRVLQRVDTCTELNPILRVHWLGQALMKAIEGGHLSIVEYIHSVHPAPLAVMSFEVAAGAGQLEVLQWLCTHRYDRLCIDVPPIQRDVESMRCCFSYQCEGAAKRNNRFHVLRWLYDTGYIQNMEDVGDAAAAMGDLEMVRWLHERAVENAFTDGAMDSAARQGHMDIVRFLHENRREGPCVTTMMGAMVAGHTEIVEYLRQPGFCSVIYPETVISMACTSGRIDLLEEFRAFLNDGESREVALDMAVANGQLEVAQWLGRHPVSTDALSKAAMDGHVNVLQWVHEHDCGEWAPHIVTQAALAGQLPVIQWAQTHRSELITTVALDCAAATGHLDLLKWIIEHTGVQCSTDAMDDAATNGHLDVVRWLHEQGVGYTTNCMDGAAQHGHLELLVWLYDHGYDRVSANAMRSGSLDVVRWLHERFALFVDPGAVIRSIALGDLMFMKWIHVNTRVRVSPRLVQIVLPMGHSHMLEWMHEHRPDEFEVRNRPDDAEDDDDDLL